MGSNARKIRRAGARRGADVISLDEIRQQAHREYVLAAAEALGVGPKPETGQRTPKPSIQRWDRDRFNELSLDRLVGILRKAEDGNTEELADLWLRMLKTDAHLRSVWDSLTAPIYGARWETLPAETDPARAELAKRAADGCAEALRYTENLPAVFAALLNAEGVGYSPAELIWERGTLFGQPAWVPRIVPIHSRRFRFSDNFELGLYDDGAAVGELEKAGWPVERIYSRGTCLARLPAGKYVVHQPIGIHDYPSAAGLVHAVARWYWVKQIVTKYWLSGAEIGANPRVIGKIVQEGVGTTLDELHADLERLSGDGVIALRAGVDVEIHEGKAAASSEVWETLFKRMDLAQSKIILGSTLNVEIDSSGGNRAASESQADITIRPRQQRSAAQMHATIKRDVFRWVIEYNPHLFPKGTPIPTSRSVLVEETATIDQLAVDSGAVRVDEMRASRGLPIIGGDAGQAFIAPVTRGAGQATTPGSKPAAPPPAPPV